MSFNPNTRATTDDGIFGLPFNESNSNLVLVGVPFEATTSYLGGTSKAPEKILECSKQVDLYHPYYKDAWNRGIFLRPLSKSKSVLIDNRKAKALATRSRKVSEKTAAPLIKQVNALSQKTNAWLEKQVRDLHAKNKLVGVVGGDHSVPFASIQEHLKTYPDMGILHFDAHFDLRNAYEGFEYSHASVMRNVIDKLSASSLVQVGLRDFCEEELSYAKSKKEITYFLDRDLFQMKATGESWSSITEKILKPLPEKVYVSFDIDGLEPNLCPGTGTPVPGGLTFNEATFVLQQLHASGRKLVGFDLVEVGPTEWDGNVGARLLFELSLATLASTN